MSPPPPPQHVMCHVSCVTCHVSHVTIFWTSGEAYRWIVCYQRGLPCLVSLLMRFFGQFENHLLGYMLVLFHVIEGIGLIGVGLWSTLKGASLSCNFESNSAILNKDLSV